MEKNRYKRSGFEGEVQPAYSGFNYLTFFKTLLGIALIAGFATAATVNLATANQEIRDRDNLNARAIVTQARQAKILSEKELASQNSREFVQDLESFCETEGISPAEVIPAELYSQVKSIASEYD